MDIDQVRLSLLPYRDYCQDILEARLRSVLYEQLNITRDIPFDKVVRLESGQWPGDRQPILASLTNQADKWEILCLARQADNLIKHLHFIIVSWRPEFLVTSRIHFMAKLRFYQNICWQSDQDGKSQYYGGSQVQLMTDLEPECQSVLYLRNISCDDQVPSDTINVATNVTANYREGFSPQVTCQLAAFH